MGPLTLQEAAREIAKFHAVSPSGADIPRYSYLSGVAFRPGALLERSDIFEESPKELTQRMENPFPSFFTSGMGKTYFLASLQMAQHHRKR